MPANLGQYFRLMHRHAAKDFAVYLDERYTFGEAHDLSAAFANALVQWDDVSKVLQANIRVDWIHTPGSDLFLVIDTGYLTGDLLDPRDPRWLRRTGVVKVTYLKAF